MAVTAVAGTGWRVLGLLLLALASSGSAWAQASGEGLLIYFREGAVTLTAAEREKLDQAARLYRDGNPIVMIVTGATDTTGSASTNLRLSLERANMVVRGLVDRGIPVERLQVVGKGETEPKVATGDGVSDAGNRVVEINWR